VRPTPRCVSRYAAPLLRQNCSGTLAYTARPDPSRTRKYGWQCNLNIMTRRPAVDGAARLVKEFREVENLSGAMKVPATCQRGYIQANKS